MNLLCATTQLMHSLKRFSRTANTTLQRLYGSKIEKKSVTLIAGDGIGGELTCSVVDLFRAATVPIKWETYLTRGAFSELALATTHFDDPTRADDGTIPRKRTKLPWDPEIHAADLHESIIKNRVVLKGPFVSQVGKGLTSIDKMLALKYELFGQVIPVQSLPLPKEHAVAAKIPFQDLDLLIVRENTEAEYSGLEHSVVPGVVESLKVVTKEKSARIAEYAFQLARETGRKTVIAVHKANIMKMGDGLFLKCCQAAAEKYSDIQFKDLIVDNAAMQLVSKPQQFKDAVIVTTNLYGSIVSNIASGLIGGAGVSGGFSASADIAIFEQGTRHIGIDIANRNIANPTGMIKSSVYMLNHMKLYPWAHQIGDALVKTIKQGKHLTQDIGGNSSTVEFVHDIIGNLEAPNLQENKPFKF